MTKRLSFSIIEFHGNLTLVMSIAEIEAELPNLSADELHRLALRTWSAYVQKEDGEDSSCDETNPDVLAALDEAVSQADSTPSQGHSGAQVRTHLKEWTSK